MLWLFQSLVGVLVDLILEWVDSRQNQFDIHTLNRKVADDPPQGLVKTTLGKPSTTGWGTVFSSLE